MQLTIELPDNLVTQLQAKSNLNEIIIHALTQYLAEPQVYSKADDWKAFIEQTYGCLADTPIERPPQGALESREDLV